MNRLAAFFALPLAACGGVPPDVGAGSADPPHADAGSPGDAGSAEDEGSVDGAAPEDPRCAIDAGIPEDAGVTEDGPDDAGTLDDAELAEDAGLARDAGFDEDAGPLPPPRFWWPNEIFPPSVAPDPIWGDGHVHSTYSGDGTRSAVDMIRRAHDLGADFVWITDHGATPNNPGGIKAGEFDACSAAALAETAGRFAGCGVEYRLGYTRPNGSKVYEAWHQIVHDIRRVEFGELMSANGYTSWTAYHDDLASTHGAYATLTHPSGPTAWYDDDDVAFRDTNPAHHADVELCELNGGDDRPSNGNNLLDGLHAYLRFLNDGWQVSPVWNSDMHGFYAGVEKAKGYGTWVDKTTWGPGNYRAALREAARAHRSFANHPGDERNWIRMITLDASGAPEAMMGSTLPPRGSITLRISANIAGGAKRWRFKLFTNQHRAFDDPFATAGFAGTQVAAGGTEQRWEVTFPTAGVHWVVAYASPTTGAPGSSTQYLVSAPIWLNDQ